MHDRFWLIALFAGFMSFLTSLLQHNSPQCFLHLLFQIEKKHILGGRILERAVRKRKIRMSVILMLRLLITYPPGVLFSSPSYSICHMSAIISESNYSSTQFCSCSLWRRQEPSVIQQLFVSAMQRANGNWLENYGW